MRETPVINVEILHCIKKITHLYVYPVHMRKVLEMIKKKLEQLGFSNLPKLKSIGKYKPYRISKELIFISGQLPIQGDQLLSYKKITSKTKINEVKKHIELATSNLLNVLDFAIVENQFDLNKVGCLNLKGYLNTDNSFTEHSTLFNFASELLIKVLGEKMGSHSRSVIGVNSLPLNSPVEIDAIFCVNY